MDDLVNTEEMGETVEFNIPQLTNEVNDEDEYQAGAAQAELNSATHAEDDHDHQETQPSEFEDYLVVDEVNEDEDTGDQLVAGVDEEELEATDEDYFYPKFQQMSLDGLLQDVDLQAHKSYSDLNIYLPILHNRLVDDIKQMLAKHRGIKFWVAVHVSYINPKKHDEKVLKVYLNTGNLQLTNEFQLEEVMKTIKDRILLRHAHFIREQSGLILKKIHSTRFKVAEYLPLGGSKHHELPEFLKSKKAIINVKNKDNRCFGYAILSALHPPTHHENDPKVYNRYFRQYELDQFEYPVRVDQIPQIENKLHININVYSIYDDQGKGRYPIYISQTNYPKTIDLLYWNDHYAWIKNFSRFMGDQNSDGHARFWCKRCLGHFKVKQAFETHQMYCKRSDLCEQIYTMPAEGSKVGFKHFR